MGIYLDAVLDLDMQPLFNGTPETTVEWLEKHPYMIGPESNYLVAIGRSLKVVSVSEYLKQKNH